MLNAGNLLNAKKWSRRGLLKLVKPLILMRAWAPVSANFGGGLAAAHRDYRADAIILLFGMPIFSKAGVGSGFSFVEDLTEHGPRTRRMGFGGGSWPDRAGGLNRLGYIHETVTEAGPRTGEASYFGFMTTSQEEKLEEAHKALSESQQNALFSAIQGESRRGAYTAKFTRFLSKDANSWRQWHAMAAAAERSFNGECVSSREERGSPGMPETVLATLLYSLLKVRESNFAPVRVIFIYGGLQRTLETVAGVDAKLGDKLRQRGIVKRAEAVVHVIGTTKNLQTGAKTRFSVWWDKDSQSPLPVRIELEPRSFLRLAFEADPKAGEGQGSVKA